MKHRILLVDDEVDNLLPTKSLLERWGYEVETAIDGEEAISKFKNAAAAFAVAVLDYQMPGKNGAEVARELRAMNDETVILIYSCHNSKDVMLSSFRAGGADFIEKDEKDIGYLREAIEKACRKFEECRVLKPDAHRQLTSAEELLKSVGMIGRSERMANEVATKILRYRDSSLTVFILGKTGSGKELVARALHGDSPKKFIALNCAQFTNKDLLASELFGYEQGAFTGAIKRKAGLFESVCGGTVFLDELHHLSLEAQAQLLRAVEQKKIRRVGGNEEIDVSFRLIAATRPDIKELVDNGIFKEDLYYRLRCLSIEIPSLNERLMDIEPLVTHFCELHFKRTGKKQTFQMRTVKLLENHDWPGNVRELESYVYSLLTDSDKLVIDPKQLDHRFFKNSSEEPKAATLTELNEQFEKERRRRILMALDTSGSATEAAKKLGIRRTTLHTLLSRLGLRKEYEKSLAGRTRDSAGSYS